MQLLAERQNARFLCLSEYRFVAIAAEWNLHNVANKVARRSKSEATESMASTSSSDHTGYLVDAMMRKRLICCFRQKCSAFCR